jgi:rSAM/selenodomain-associated transferase 1
VTAALVVFAKAPRPGFVKTRMTPPFSPAEACALYVAMLDDVLEASARAAAELGIDPVLAVHPPDACAALARSAPAAFRVIAQRGADLGARMAWAVDELAAGGASPVLIRGSDSPALGPETLIGALAALREHDLVLSPDRDGGYNLVGLCRPMPGLFAHAMSTPSVLDDTLSNARRLGLRYHVLADGFDVDTVEDLAWLAEARRTGAAALCPRTLALLDEWGGWSYSARAPERR